MKKLFLLASTLLLISMTALAPAAAQNTCDDPFAGVTVRFDWTLWELTDFCQSSIPLDSILWGGVPPDGIPPIDTPLFESITAADGWLQPQSPVIALEVNDDARAYPLAIMTWHEIVNDTIGEVPVVVTFCPLCNSALVFERTVDDAELTFGVSGNLRNSDLVMWDRQTQSWWQQFTGEGIVGFYNGQQLTPVPSLVTSYGAFVAQFPNGQVLSRDTGINRSYGSNPYTNYDATENPFLFDGEIDRRLSATEHVLAGIVGGEAIAYPFPLLREQGVINDVVGEVPVVAFWQPGAASALGDSTIDEGEDIGWAALYRRVVDERELTFSIDLTGAIMDAETGTIWNAFGQAIEGELAGTQLQLQIAAPHFWFAWAAFRPETRLFGT
jgi:hypothetical protein